VSASRELEWHLAKVERALGEPHRVGAGRLAQDDAESVNALLSCWASVRSSRVAAGRSVRSAI